MANYSIPNSSPASGRISTGSLRRLRRQNRRPPVCRSVSGAWWLDVRKRRQVRHGESVLWRSAALQSALRAPKIRRWTLSARSFLQSGERRVPGGPRGLQNRRRHASGEVGSIPILSARFFRHPERSSVESKDPVDIPKSESSGFLDFARNDKLMERR